MSDTKKHKEKGIGRYRLLVAAGYLVVGVAAMPAVAIAHQMMNGTAAGNNPISSLLSPIALGKAPVLEDHADIKFIDKAAVEAFYEGRDNKPYWLGGFKKGEEAQALMTLIDESWTHGLNPESYHREELRALLGDPSPENRQRAELLLTDAALRYAHDISGMRVSADALGLRQKYFRQPPAPTDIARTLADTRDIPGALATLAPQNEYYNRMRAELVTLAQESARSDDLLPLRFGGVSIFRPGESHRDVAALRQVMGVEYNPMYGPENYYDDNLASAVMSFQRDRNLSPDGVIGPSTLAVINKSHKDTMNQLVANMERQRWIGDDMPDRYIMVNIPSQRLWAIENGEVAQEMNVVVGLPTRQTKQFTTQITGVRFNPTWTVPLNLKMADFKPKLINDPGYLDDKGIQVYHNGRSLDPHSIDWETIGWKEMNQLRFTQRPGDHNALGKVRILMPSDYDIYLHDTNHPEFFEQTQRALSSGCIRLSRPEDIARFILKDNAGWSDERMRELIDRGKMVEVEAEHPFPVYIVYQSVWLDESGGLVFGADIYNQDKKLIDALSRRNAYAFPQAEQRTMAVTQTPERLATAD